MSLQLFWDCRAQLNLANYVYKGIVLCAGGYYYFAIKALFSLLCAGTGRTLPEENRLGSCKQSSSSSSSSSQK